MSTIKNNPLLKSATRMLGDTVVFRKVRGKLQMANGPGKRTVKPSEKQAAVQRKFKNATLYAKRQILEADSKALYT